MKFSFGRWPRLRGPVGQEVACTAAPTSMASALRIPVLAGVLAATSATCQPTIAVAREVVATEAHGGRTIRLRLGDRLRLTLPSNGTTGFSWRVAWMPANLRRIADSVEAPTEGAGVSPGLVGAGGLQVLIFEARRPGNGVLRLRYRQPWKGGMLGDRLAFRIESSK